MNFHSDYFRFEELFRIFLDSQIFLDSKQIFSDQNPKKSASSPLISIRRSERETLVTRKFNQRDRQTISLAMREKERKISTVSLATISLLAFPVCFALTSNRWYDTYAAIF